MQVLVAGGGLGGLTAALALLRRGFEVTVLEQAAQLKEVGAGVQLSPNCNHALFALGLEKDVMAVASETAGKEVRLWNTGQTWPLFDLGAVSRERYGYPYLTVHRAHLHAAIARGVEQQTGGTIVLGAKVAQVDAEGSRPVVITTDGRRFSADVVVGADGVHSVVRRQLFGDDDPQFSGVAAWRGVIEADKLPAHLREPKAINWVGPGAHVIHYPLERGKLINFVGAVEKQGWTVESWTERGTHEECEADFRGWHEDVHTLIRATQVPYKWALMVREPMPQWSRGRVTLLGDACHPTLPMLASGAAMAIEDGYILARVLEKHGEAPEHALLRYEALRKERTARVVRGSAANTRRFHNPALAHAEGAADYVSREWTEERIRERYEWLFEYDVDRVQV